MGSKSRTLSGGAKQHKNADLQNKYQKEGMKGIFKNLNPKDFAEIYKQMSSLPKEDMKAFTKGMEGFLNTNEKAYSKPFMKGIEGFLNPSEREMRKSFETGVVNPTMDIFNKQVIPGIQERFVGENLGSSSAMNQALSNAATDVSTQIGSQLPSFLQNQQQNRLAAMGMLPGMISQGQNNRLQALNMIPGARSNFMGPMQNALASYQNLLGETTFQPVISQSSGIMAPAVQGAATAATAAAMRSSKDVKENIKDYTEGLSAIDKMEVKSYDYIDGEKNRLGIIAEDAPPEIRTKLDGINAVDLYGMMSLMVNAIKELSGRLELLEAKS